MSLKKRLVSGAAALALAGTAAMAVNIAQDGTGDYLIAPVYVANSAGWETKIKVVNTNTTQAVVAKVVIRDGATSQEVLDFPIYLTPGDVWTATLYNDGGTVKIKSTDDSLMLGMNPPKTLDCNGNPVEYIEPIQVGIDKALNTPDGAKVTKGYVEVFGLAEYNATKIAEAFGVEWKEGCDLNKTWLYTVARDYTQPSNLNSGLPGAGLVLAEDVTPSDLMGEQVIYNETGANAEDMRYMKLSMLALEDVATEAKVTDVIGPDTKLDNVADINEGDYRALMQKQHVYVMYDGDGSTVAPFQTIFTFPYMHNAPDGQKVASYGINESKIVFRDNEEHAKACGVPSGACITTPCTTIQNPSDPNSDLSGGSTPTPETCPEKTFTDEVQVVVNSGNEYAYKVGGYIDIDLSEVNITGDTNTTGPSLPVIPTTMTASKVGDIFLNNHLYNQYAGPSN